MNWTNGNYSSKDLEALRREYMRKAMDMAKRAPAPVQESISNTPAVVKNDAEDISIDKSVSEVAEVAVEDPKAEYTTFTPEDEVTNEDSEAEYASLKPEEEAINEVSESEYASSEPEAEAVSEDPEIEYATYSSEEDDEKAVFNEEEFPVYETANDYIKPEIKLDPDVKGPEEAPGPKQVFRIPNVQKPPCSGPKCQVRNYWEQQK